MTLFDITADLLALNDVLEGNGNQFDDPEVQAAVARYLSDLLAARAEKLDGYVALVKQLAMEAEAMEAEAVAFKAKAESRARRVAWLKECLKGALLATNTTKVTTPKGYAVSVQKNGGKRPVALAPGLTPEQLPAEFVRTKVEIDLEAIRGVLETGEPLPFASLGEAGSHVRIK